MLSSGGMQVLETETLLNPAYTLVPNSLPSSSHPPDDPASSDYSVNDTDPDVTAIRDGLRSLADESQPSSRRLHQVRPHLQ
jgi:hypothetical protein